MPIDDYMSDIINYLELLKRDYEKAIISGGEEEVHALIRSKKLINYVHEFIKSEFIRYGINPNKIYPHLGETHPELYMAGFLKKKSQDISILAGEPTPEVISEGVLIGQTDKIGKILLNESISVNIRSQLSSILKNFDTLYERTFAEALNLHLRVPKLIMGEVYLIPLVAYDSNKIKKRQIGFKEKLPLKYIPAFQKINRRDSADRDEYKYEQVCLLIVDFRDNPPTIINNVQELVEREIIDKEEAAGLSMEGLTIDNFVKDVLELYKKRHGSLQQLK